MAVTFIVVCLVVGERGLNVWRGVITLWLRGEVDKGVITLKGRGEVVRGENMLKMGRGDCLRRGERALRGRMSGETVVWRPNAPWCSISRACYLSIFNLILHYMDEGGVQ